ncbi:MAG TPA: L,D-transpeptidase [Nocardioidaceae bacterium]|nr:L,D-transpeptidase [Nocardioidaceae bacterium]
MSRRPPPKHRRNTSPQRLLAMSSAAAITVVAVAGAAGFGPGGAVRTERTAAQISMPSAPNSQEIPEPGASTGDPSVSVPTPDTSDGVSKATGGSTDAANPDAGGTESDAANQDAGDTASGTPGSGGTSEPAAAVLPPRSGAGKRIVYDISDQRVWLVEGDHDVASTYRVSGSRIRGLVDPGSYEVYSKSRRAVSYDYKETMNYMVRFTQGRSAAIGFHDIPRYVDDETPVQTRQQLGTPLSAGCVRQRRSDAKRLWEFAPVGTTVVVTA